MKKLKIFLIVLLILFADSCTAASQNISYNNESENIYFNITKSCLTQAAGNSIYFDTSLFDMESENRSVTKYDTETNLTLFVCADSSCLHNTSECPFYNKEPDLMYVSDRYIMYKQMSYSDNDEINEQLMLYDMETGTARKICNTSCNDYTQVLFTGRYIYYYNITDDADKSWAINICRYDTVSRKITTVCTSDFSDNYIVSRILFAANDRLYFTDDRCMYSTDYNGNDKQIITDGSFMYDVITDGKYIYYGKDSFVSADGITLESVYRMNLDGTGDLSLEITCENGNFFVANNEIYYFPYESVDIGEASIPGYASDTVTLHNGGLYKCKLDGMAKTEVYRFSGDFSCYRLFTHDIIGNCIYGLYTAWNDADHNGIFTSGEDISSFSDMTFRIMKINLVNGQTEILEIE